jgi:hypothetical protein
MSKPDPAQGSGRRKWRRCTLSAIPPNFQAPDSLATARAGRRWFAFAFL